MKERLVKCPYCNENLYRSEGITLKNKRCYHPHCLEKEKEIKKEKEGNTLVKCEGCGEKVRKKEAVKDERGKNYHSFCLEEVQLNRQERKELDAYICELFQVDKPSVNIAKQINDFKQQGYRYKGMELSLRYFHETLGNRPTQDSVRIIPYVYEQAKELYVKRMNIVEKAKSFQQSSETVVYIDTTLSRKKKQIDMSEL